MEVLSSSSGATLDLGLPGTDRLTADVLKNERQFDLAFNEPPSVVVPPVTDEEEAAGIAPPPVDESSAPEIPESSDGTEEAPLDGNEDISLPEIDQGTVAPPEIVEDPVDDFGTEEDGAEENNEDANGPVDEEEEESAAVPGSSGDVDADSGAKTGELSGTADASASVDKRERRGYRLVLP